MEGDGIVLIESSYHTARRITVGAEEVVPASPSLRSKCNGAVGHIYGTAEGTPTIIQVAQFNGGIINLRDGNLTLHLVGYPVGKVNSEILTAALFGIGTYQIIYLRSGCGTCTPGVGDPPVVIIVEFD